MAGTFTWRPDYPIGDDYEPNVRRTPFGDGYSQRSGKGINNDPARLELTFSERDDVEASDIMTFLKSKAGSESFTWVDAEGVSGLYIAPKYGRVRQDEDKNMVKASFERVYGG